MESVEPVEARVGKLERAHGRADGRIATLERGQAELVHGLEAREAALRAEIAEIYRDAARAVAEARPATERKPKWLQRRHELRLLRLERDRKIRHAEQRLAERSEESVAALARYGHAVEKSVREAGAGAELGLQAAAGDTSSAVRRRLEELAAGERRLTALVERIEIAERRLRSTERRLGTVGDGIELAERAGL